MYGVVFQSKSCQPTGQPEASRLIIGDYMSNGYKVNAQSTEKKTLTGFKVIIKSLFNEGGFAG